MLALTGLVRAIVLGLCSTALAPVASPVARQKAVVAQKEISKELARLFSEHFADQGQRSGSNEAEIARRGTVRRDRVMKIVEGGGLATLEDWDNAAVILQYGAFPEDFLLAHVLSIRPAIADTGLARNLAAVTLDHYLQSIDRPEVFGTMSETPSRDSPDSPDSIGGFGDPKAPLPNGLRRVFTLGPLPGKEPRRPPASAAELRKLLAAAEKEGGGAVLPDRSPEWLARARELVVAEALKSGADYLMAAQILRRGSSADDLLLAHVCALAASFQKQGEGERLAVETLDRFLLAAGKPQILGTAKGEGGQPIQPVKLAPEVVLAGYGLTRSAK